MFLDNLSELLWAMYGYCDRQLVIKDINGTVRNVKQGKTSISGIGFAGTNPYVMFGTNATPVSKSDFAFEKLEGLTVKCTNLSDSADNSFISVRYQLTNNNSTDVTIAEIGVYQVVYYSSSSSCNVLIFRELLDVPLTIPGNSGVGQITLTVTKDGTTAVAEA